MRPDTPKLSRYLSIPAILFLTLLALICCNSYQKSKQQRAQIAAKKEGPVVIAVAWPQAGNNRSLLNGIALAVEQINQAGGIMGKELNTVHYNTIDASAHEVAKKIAQHRDIVAVIGHYTSTEAIKASITYEENGIIFLAPSATNPCLTSHDFEYVFRIVPSDTMIGRHMARFTHDRGYQKIVILDDNSIYGTGLADIFYTAAVDLKLEIVEHKVYFNWQTDYRPLINGLSKTDFDAVFLAGQMPNAADVIKQFHEMGLPKPIIAGDSLDQSDLTTIAGPAANGTVVPSVFNPFSDAPRVKAFVLQFKARFRTEPETWDALGYDAIQLLAFSFNKSHTTVPIVVSATLRFTKHWQGVTGDFTFEPNGELSEKQLYFKQVRNGRFEYMEE